jgi:tetratricopeptide (TPR) repeat protein
MNFQVKLLGLLLSQTLGTSGEALADRLADYTKERSATLPSAIAQANERTCQALELALSGDGLGGHLRHFFARGELQALCAPIQQVVAAQGGEPFRRACLRELKQAREAGALSGELTAGLAAAPASGFERVTDPEGLLAAAWQVMGQAAAELQVADYPNLARLLRDQTPGKPLLLTAFGYYLRGGILQDPDLTDEMSFRALRRLGTEQAKGFAAIGQAADRLGLGFRSALDEATAEVLVRLEGLAEQVGDTHRLTLDIEAAIAGLGSGQGAALDLLQEIRQQLHRLPGSQGPVQRRLSFTLHSEAEKRFVKDLLARYRALPAEQRETIPALINGLGKLELAAGDPAAAGEHFGAVAAQVQGNDKAEAEAHYNRYRALLEQQDWAEATTALNRAAALDPNGFAPFDLHKYPANLLVRPARDGLALKVIDFGLALKQQAVAASIVAGNGGKSLWGQAAVGTWEYAAPEQMGRRPEPVGPYSDVNGFGKTLCRALLGETSLDPEDYQRFGFEHPLILLLNRCLKDDPTLRPQSFEEVLQGLATAQAETKPSPPPRADRERERAQHREVPDWSRVLTPQDIHGWDTSKVPALQRQVTEAFGKPVLFRDRLKDSGEGPELVIILPGRFAGSQAELGNEQGTGLVSHRPESRSVAAGSA